MIKMCEISQKFIADNIPELLEESDVNAFLDKLDYAIMVNGFAPPDYYDYNDFGRAAQKVYDDVFLNYYPDDKYRI